ncbi:MAG: hypothetical protein BKP49_01445 [Treponema sp. CETP13]|nr:MAG: hypothetical protein BKP49_01445 [Treponema sp. CETP13]
MSLAMAMLLIVNAIFDGTETGIQKAFTRSFTGDIVIRPISDMPLSLFGDETPVTGELSEIPQIIPYLDCYKELKSIDKIENFTPQLTGVAQLEIVGKKQVAPLFGINGTSYIKLMSNITILKGQPFSDYEEGAMLSSKLVENLEKASGKKINIGDSIQFIVADASTLRIRAVPVTAIYSYSADNDLLNRIVLVDYSTVTDLMGLETTTEQVNIAEENTALLDVSVDDLFSNQNDIVLSDNNSTSLDSLQFNHDEKKDTTTVDTSIPSIEAHTLWNFIIISVKQGENSNKLIKQLNNTFHKKDWPLEAVSWRTAAGSTAIYLYWMRMILNIGVVIILITGFFVINNTLVINVMDRTKEIGMLQAIGAGKPFISKLFFLETYILTIISGFVGIILGRIGTLILNIAHISFTNEYIIQLFGSTVLAPQITISNIISIILLVLLLGFLGCISPIRVALQETPVSAMRGIE